MHEIVPDYVDGHWLPVQVIDRPSRRFRFDADGKITHFKVMVRPLKAVNHVHQLMKAQLEAMMASKAS